MKPLVPALAAALLVCGAAGGQPPAAVKDAYIKVRVEVEARGVLELTDTSAVLLTRYRYFDAADDKKEVPAAEGVPPYRVELDFARHPELRELAKVLNNKEVLVTGLSELRHVYSPQPPGPGFQPGGFGFPPPPPPPTWRLQPNVVVTGLKSPPGKR